MRLISFIAQGVYLIGGLFFHYMERLANWFIGYNGKTEYVMKGRCKKCGKCCNLLAIQYPNFLNRFPRLLNTTIKWHQLRYNFLYLNKEGNYLLYQCNYPRPDGTCRIYRFRPRLCREYPRLKLYGRPPTHVSCGFYFVRRDGRVTFDEVLHKADEKFSDAPSSSDARIKFL